MTPSANIRSGSGALSVGEGLARQSRGYIRCDFSYLSELSPARVLSLTETTRPRRNLQALRCLQFLPRSEIDHHSHVASAKLLSLVVADEDDSAERFCGSRKSFRGRENPSEREKVSE